MKIERDENGNIYFNGIEPIQKEDYFNREHPMCRCSIIKMPEKIYFTYITKYLINEYLEECKHNLWIN